MSTHSLQYLRKLNVVIFSGGDIHAIGDIVQSGARGRFKNTQFQNSCRTPLGKGAAHVNLSVIFRRVTMHKVMEFIGCNETSTSRKWGSVQKTKKKKTEKGGAC